MIQITNLIWKTYLSLQFNMYKPRIKKPQTKTTHCSSRAYDGLISGDHKGRKPYRYVHIIPKDNRTSL